MRVKASEDTTDGAGVAPFLKWAGSKRQLLSELRDAMPRKFNRYFEPFVGSGSLFFAVRPAQSVLSDSNLRLIRTYRAIRDDVSSVVGLLHTYPPTREFFEELRARSIDSASDAEVAAWMVYLNRVGFNGLYRVNKSGQFNVPFGSNDTVTVCREPSLRACSAALQGVEILHAPFELAVKDAQRGDFVYFDPPYVPLSVTSSFRTYTQDGFDSQDQVRLRDLALELKSRGVQVLLSNSSAPEVEALYAEGFEISRVSARRNINSKASGRGAVQELLIR
jgi:DNA adenine methylase